MTKIYSTAELISILAIERRACLNGHRLDLAATPSGINPVIDRFLQPDGIQKFSAYANFRQMVHDYQHEHQVSGIVWQCLSLKNRALRFPKVDDQLISLKIDRGILCSAKPAIIDFWQAVTQDMELYLSLQGGKRYQAIMAADSDRKIQQAEWASLTHHGHNQGLEVLLQLGWGQPEAAIYRRGLPESGSEFIHAVHRGHYPLN